jgi:hypothetical protein
LQLKGLHRAQCQHHLFAAKPVVIQRAFSATRSGMFTIASCLQGSSRTRQPSSFASLARTASNGAEA